MINAKCKGCTKFLTNDCRGLEELNPDTCAGLLKKQKKEVDVTGCC
ncbi:MAG: hypothetical protein ACOWWO_06630 [Peptococcaceae bacterium]